ncbi:hypothetical protein HETIRDRAFT_103399 [Heterobasidion irregulare TC 32-1]|uniref:Uncharacterized protein n=1 Tax=Heterobasidion irregulare (strain TC 32-1) TaxID=747525 RepID=W4K2W4_HETIT|nr:uncharacterized protein HETIRDRAFT_103399 [Heterobasidion irregulare TC 32-1]ETW80074.1 hypothetical protein HETIRDRAFT_103399 [Heterobasidion irregulare TC 32-1]
MDQPRFVWTGSKEQIPAPVAVACVHRGAPTLANVVDVEERVTSRHLLKALPSAPIAAGQLVLTTDQLGVPARFLLHQILAAYIKTAAYNSLSTGSKAVVVSVSEPLTRWEVAARTVSAGLLS